MSESSEEEIPHNLISIVYILISLSIIGGFINLYQLIKFIKNRTQRFLSSRRPTLIIVYCSISLFISIICTPILFYYEALAAPGAVKEWMEYGIEFIEEILTIILLTIIALRTWLLFFEYNFVQSTIDQNWRGIIDPNEQNFWLNSRKTWGNTQHIVIISTLINFPIFIALITLAIMIALSPVYNNALFHYFTIYALGIPFALFMLVILYKIDQHKTIEDTFFIQKEIKYLTVIVLFRIIALLINTVVHSGVEHYFHLFFFCIEVISRFLLVYIQSWWVLHKLNQENTAKQVIKRDIVVEQSVDTKKSCTMNDVFTHENGMGLLTFIRHCVNELSVENVLFLIELCQYKNTFHIGATGTASDDDMDRFVDVFDDFKDIISMKKQLVFADLRGFVHEQKESIPRRIRNNDENKTDWCYEYAMYLYKKYVDFDADLAVNISSKVRKNLSNVFRFDSFHDDLFSDLAKKQINIERFRDKCLYHIFDAAFYEIWLLLEMDTFWRFKRSKQYSKIWGTISIANDDQ